jgi:hypothetical protein
MMSIIPTQRPWLTSGRLALVLALAALLMPLGDSVMRLLTGAETSLVACLALSQ